MAANRRRESDEATRRWRVAQDSTTTWPLAPSPIPRSRRRPVALLVGVTATTGNALVAVNVPLLAAQIAEGTFAAAPDFDTAFAYATDVKARARALGRDPDQLLVMPGLSAFIADSDGKARAVKCSTA